jgi:N4-(beta-N-acetylglucosaminyl)-L-asparaginase
VQRREFLRRGSLGAGAAVIGAVGATTAQEASREVMKVSRGPLAISSANGLRSVTTAVENLREGASTLDAVVAGVNRVEEDPDDITVGYGGLPNERGVVELDAAVMDGPSGRAGAVGALRNIKYPSRVARLVMEQTDHVLLVGQGALEFARASGIQEEELLTEKARKIWLWWRQGLSSEDDWIRPPESEWPPEVKEYVRSYGTVHCSAMDAGGNFSSATTTSGLFFKIPGRVGDSPIIGAGLYVDNEVGACGSTGRGEEVLLSCGSFAVVEQLRRGLSPVDAGLEVLKRIADRAKRLPRLLKDDGRPDFNVKFYVLDKKGRYAGCSLWSGSDFILHDGARARTLEAAYLLKRDETGEETNR